MQPENQQEKNQQEKTLGDKTFEELWKMASTYPGPWAEAARDEIQRRCKAYYEPPVNETNEKLAREAAEEIGATTSSLMQRRYAIILAAIEKAVAAVPDGMLSGGVQKMDAAAQPQRSEPQEWTEERVKQYLKWSDGVEKLAMDFTAALAASDAKLARVLSFLLTLFHDDKTAEHQQQLIWKEIEAIGDTPSYLIQQLRDLRQQLAAEREKVAMNEGIEDELREANQRYYDAKVELDAERERRKPLVEAALALLNTGATRELRQALRSACDAAMAQAEKQPDPYVEYCKDEAQP